MPVVYRRDEVVTDTQGHPISGAQVWVCTHPADTTTQPPSPLKQLYGHPLGTNEITQPIDTDQDGRAFYYVEPGIYTVVIGGPYIGQVTLRDQIVNAPQAPAFNADNSSQGTITGMIDGANRVFQLSAAPNPVWSLVLAVNGIVQMGWMLSGSALTLAVAPQPQDNITARYTYILEE